MTILDLEDNLVEVATHTQKKVGVDESSGASGEEKKLITGRGTQSLLLHYHIFHMHLEAVAANTDVCSEP